jgi:hypothetical protein
MPKRVLDLFVEFRCLTNGLPLAKGKGLLGALAYYGLAGIDAGEKEDMRQLAIRGGPFTDRERQDLLAYCQTDVDALAVLLPAMLPQIDLPRALLRGRYMVAAARMEWNGIPIDTETLSDLREHWGTIKARLICAVDATYGIYVPTGRRELDPESLFGSVILEAAKAGGVDPYRLAEAADFLWREERETNKEVFEARKAARQVTGLTHAKINRWEDSGHDYTDYPGLDLVARELARVHPALGIGPGYTIEGGVDDTDYRGPLWQALRDHDEKYRPKHHPEILRRAVDMVLEAGGEEYFGPLTFSTKRFENYLIRTGIPWPKLPGGELSLEDDVFELMAKVYPKEIGPIRELRHVLSQMRLWQIWVGVDGRNRTILSAFAAKTGRNQPSNSRFIFGPSKWFRSLIKPGPGRAVAYCDWSAQELGIAAKLSGDEVMMAAYACGDPYIFLAQRFGVVPPGATKETHREIREQFKTLSLGVLYGLSEWGLSRRLNEPLYRGRLLLQMHKETFRRFWEWSEQVEMDVMLTNLQRTVFGWTYRVGQDVNPRSFRNFPMQGNGAEMMRLACCLATERGIKVCAPVHDAILVEGSADEINDVVEQTKAAMKEASEIVLDGFGLRVGAEIVRYPDRVHRRARQKDVGDGFSAIKPV